jgi:hypothetical protein
LETSGVVDARNGSGNEPETSNAAPNGGREMRYRPTGAGSVEASSSEDGDVDDDDEFFDAENGDDDSELNAPPSAGPPPSHMPPAAGRGEGSLAEATDVDSGRRRSAGGRYQRSDVQRASDIPRRSPAASRTQQQGGSLVSSESTSGGPLTFRGANGRARVAQPPSQLVPHPVVAQWQSDVRQLQEDLEAEREAREAVQAELRAEREARTALEAEREARAAVQAELRAEREARAADVRRLEDAIARLERCIQTPQSTHGRNDTTIREINAEGPSRHSQTRRSAPVNDKNSNTTQSYQHANMDRVVVAGRRRMSAFSGDESNSEEGSSVNGDLGGGSNAEAAFDAGGGGQAFAGATAGLNRSIADGVSDGDDGGSKKRRASGATATASRLRGEQSAAAESPAVDSTGRPRPFTDDEVQAILKLVQKHGVEDWVWIIWESNGLLGGRSAAEIEDKYWSVVGTDQV